MHSSPHPDTNIGKGEVRTMVTRHEQAVMPIQKSQPSGYAVEMRAQHPIKVKYLPIVHCGQKRQTYTPKMTSIRIMG